MSNKAIISSGNFSSNYGGRQGSAVVVKGITNITLYVENSVFLNNTSAFSAIEETNDLPFWKLLTQKKYRLNFFKELCTDEFSHAVDCTSDLINYPVSKGAIYVSDLDVLVISNNTFERNDPGPLLSDKMWIGLGGRASSIYLTERVG